MTDRPVGGKYWRTKISTQSLRHGDWGKKTAVLRWTASWSWMNSSLSVFWSNQNWSVAVANRTSLHALTCQSFRLAKTETGFHISTHPLLSAKHAPVPFNSFGASCVDRFLEVLEVLGCGFDSGGTGPEGSSWPPITLPKKEFRFKISPEQTAAWPAALCRRAALANCTDVTHKYQFWRSTFTSGQVKDAYGVSCFTQALTADHSPTHSPCSHTNSQLDTGYIRIAWPFLKDYNVFYPSQSAGIR